MGQLPTGVSADWSAWGVFLETLPENDELAKMLIKLLESCSLVKSPKVGQSPPVPVLIQPDFQPPFSDYGAALNGAGLGRDVPSHLAVLIDQGDSQIAEPPKSVDLHVAFPEEGEAEPASEQEVDALSRETRHWISRHQRLTPNDSGRFTSIERRWIASQLSEFMVCEDKSLRLGAGIVALMYVTGMQLDSLLQAPVGSGGVFDIGGEYRREIRLPRHAYNPSTDVAEQFLPRETTLVLQLPETVAQWTKLYIPRGTFTFAEALGVELPKIKEYVDDIMKHLRANGRYSRIRRERIPAALAIELSLRYRDFALVHHLASSPDQDSPMISYYVVHFIDELKSRYREVTEDMLRAR